MSRRKTAGLLAFAFVALSLLSPTQAGVMLQDSYHDVPSPGAGNSTAAWWWSKMATQANSLKLAGFTAIWIPPVLKGAGGGYSNGYDPFDDYDMGSKNQQGTIPTRYGTREQLERAVAMLRANGLDVYVDMVANHRNGDDGNFNFHYVDAYGNPNAGRFQKGLYDFHFNSANLPQDPNVPSPGDDYAYQFGRDVAHINGARASGSSQSYIGSGLMQSGDWMTKALDIQGYRLDDVKGISTDWLLPALNFGAMAGKFAVGEYFDGNRDTLNYWVQTSMQNRSSVFDFSLRNEIKSMCSGGGYYDMSKLDHAGLAGINPGGAVTFVENHDTDGSDPISQNKALGYALILTSEGYPCVFYKDYSTDPGCYGLKNTLNNLIWIHENLASGPTVQRFKNSDIFAYERTGSGDGRDLLVGLNDNGSSGASINVATNFYPNTHLHDYTGHSPDVYTYNNGTSGSGAYITIPADVSGGGYVCYAPDGRGGSFTAPQYAVTQEYAGAQDLDIKPADNTALVQVCRLWVAQGKQITGALFWDANAWTSDTNVYLELNDPYANHIATGTFTQATGQGTSISATATRTGWYTFKIRSNNTPAANPKPAYWLRATYTAPQI